MKFPFDFSMALIFRLVFPGTVIACFALPFFARLVLWLGFDSVSLATLFPILCVVFGWLIVLSDSPIYMLLEGRRYWPANWLVRLFTAHQQMTLDRLQRLSAQYLQRAVDANEKAARLRTEGRAGRALRAERTAQSLSRRALELDIQTLDFPLNEQGEPYAAYPTRLGNLLTAYETYPDTVYRLDPIFYWYRLWLVLDKDVRDEIDASQSVADSGVYVSFAFFIAFVIMLLYAAGGFVWPWVHFIGLRPWRLPYLSGPWQALGLSFWPLLAGYGIYCVAVPSQRAYGELFKALFDMNLDKLNGFVDSVTNDVTKLGGDPAEQRKFRVVSRYLRWHRIRPPGGKNMTPESLIQPRSDS